MSTVGDIIKVKTWSPSVPCKIPDNIISSQFTTQKAFVPSYEKQKRPCIEQLLTNEYQRIWWQEKASWDKRMQSKAPSKKLLHRMIIRRKPQVAPPQPKKIRKPKKKKEKKVEKSEEKRKEEEKTPTQEEKIDKTEENNIEKSPK
ncbi:UPF0329 protein ECU05_1680/ECU11_0050-like [Frieseomelitta varia]|uniref:UPF0329 protein ECU05_1680/ECU11_0050-like n=1 Tax=Frieseomelitta varia TaxID=561572 RepID=UPI001CB6AA4A|nr:UPF0329 protein ECU05_1680/ECU11_0050-like [Frieseomelitta varia]